MLSFLGRRLFIKGLCDCPWCQYGESEPHVGLEFAVIGAERATESLRAGGGSSMGSGGHGMGGGGPLPAAILEQKMQSQHMEIQSLLTENQRLAATQVALRQELASAQQEMQRMTSMVAGNCVQIAING